MTKIQMRRSIIGEDGRDWTEGSVQEASPRFAAYAVQRGVAHVVGGTPAKNETTITTARDREIVPEHRDPTPRGAKRRR